DVRCLAWWRQLCDEKHECGKSQESTEIDNAYLRVIDVRNNCIISSRTVANLRYVALSYVWGGVVKLLLNQENILEFGLPGSLIEDRLPKTIVDAMTFCSRMGERYLWVDQLCIQQDSILDRMRKISRMHLIYSQAASTIIASSGANSDSGLPGLHSDRIKQTQTTVFVPYHPLSESHFLGTEPWYGRGWTMQERVLSSRNLIVTNKQVYWECSEASYCEESWMNF
ncbi:heterokaryon incompatibility protein-domain-containing protein, partial [Halenospora varia]